MQPPELRGTTILTLLTDQTVIGPTRARVSVFTDQTVRSVRTDSRVVQSAILALDLGTTTGFALRGPDGAILGRGLIAYSAEDARRIMGHKSREIEALLGYRGRDEMIHRDDLVLD